MAQRGEESSYSSSSSSVDSCEVLNVPFETVVQKKARMRVNLSGARFRTCQVQIGRRTIAHLNQQGNQQKNTSKVEQEAF